MMATMTRIISESGHLVARFFRSLSTASLSGDDERWVAEHFLPAEQELWDQLSNQDRRHAVGVAHRFIKLRPEATRAEIVGALLHDVGKIDCRLGILGRVTATIVGPRVSDRFRSYHDHEIIGARMLAEVGSDAATVELVAEEGPAYPALNHADY